MTVSSTDNEKLTITLRDFKDIEIMQMIQESNGIIPHVVMDEACISCVDAATCLTGLNHGIPERCPKCKQTKGAQE